MVCTENAVLTNLKLQQYNVFGETKMWITEHTEQARAASPPTRISPTWCGISSVLDVRPNSQFSRSDSLPSLCGYRKRVCSRKEPPPGLNPSTPSDQHGQSERETENSCEALSGPKALRWWEKSPQTSHGWYKRIANLQILTQQHRTF